MKLQRLGGYASIILLCVIVVAVVIAANTYPRLGLSLLNEMADPAKLMAALEASPSTFRMLQPVGILMALFFVIVTLSLQERMGEKAPNTMRFAVIAASIASALQLAGSLIEIPALISISGARDVSAFRAIIGITEGLAEGMINAWGWALLLIGCAAVRTRGLPQILAYILLVCGIAQVLRFAIPQLEITIVLVPVFLIWLGIALLRKQQPKPAAKEMAAAKG